MTDIHTVLILLLNSHDLKGGKKLKILVAL